MVSRLGRLDIFGPADLVPVGALLDFDNWYNGAVDIGIQVEVGGAIGAFQGELGHEGDMRQNLIICRSFAENIF